ncbi:condensation domain-containing protein [Streptomyces sp. NPDC088719]|uniref:condensation domain-containing protein n=1 Tax=Streptomyces sp. NPDC088719 TaxID=3365872 RepID=UPI00380B1A7A
MTRHPELRTAIWSSYRISGNLAVDGFIDSIETLVRRHEALRTELVELPDGDVRQRLVSPPGRGDLLACERVLARSERQFDRYVRHAVAREQAKPWDGNGPSFRFLLLRYAPDLHAFVTGFSHLAVDGVGNEILVRDLMRIHREAVAGRPAGPPPRRFAESAQRQADALERRARKAKAHDFSTVPPATQFQVRPSSQHEDGNGLSRESGLALAAAELEVVRQSADRHQCTEFHWTLAAFALTIFRFTVQDRVKISVPVNLRGVADRDVVGMYAVAVPVVIDRPVGPEHLRRFPREVGNSVLRATAMYRTGQVEVLDTSLTAQTEAWGARCRHDLTVNYRKVTGMSQGSFALADWDDYQPRVDYTFPGVGLQVFSFADALNIRVVLNSSVFSSAATARLVHAFRENLTSPGTWTRSCDPAPAGDLVTLKDAGGATVVAADIGKVEEALRRHPSVRTALVSHRTASTGATYLRADVTVDGGTTEDALRDYLLDLGVDSPHILAPSRISISATPS